MLYTTAIEAKFGYPRRSGNYPAPEHLCDQEIQTPYVMKHLKENVILKLEKNENYDGNSWADGFEKVWLESYREYNSGIGYAEAIISNSTKFLPNESGEKK